MTITNRAAYNECSSDNVCGGQGMSILHDVLRHKAISGLRLKRKLGDKIVIEHKSGDTLILQVLTFWTGWQVTLGFHAKPEDFKITRDEVAHDRVE